MLERKSYSEQFAVRFMRIGQDRYVPDLAVQGGWPEVREQIHTFVSDKLAAADFTVQLLGEGVGFIDRGTHSEGTFSFRPVGP